MKTRFVERTGTRRRAPTGMKPSIKSGRGFKVTMSITIACPADAIYSFWREFENLARFMTHVVSVTESGDTSHWVIKTASGKELEWDSRIIEDKPGEMISWQSLEGADVDNAGSVWFMPTPSGHTRVKVAMKYSPPGGKVGAVLAKIFGDSAKDELVEDLKRLKNLLENGETSERRSRTSKAVKY
jgi:uncharacterized membrane protein